MLLPLVKGGSLALIAIRSVQSWLQNGVCLCCVSVSKVYVQQPTASLPTIAMASNQIDCWTSLWQRQIETPWGSRFVVESPNWYKTLVYQKISVQFAVKCKETIWCVGAFVRHLLLLFLCCYCCWHRLDFQPRAVSPVWLCLLFPMSWGCVCLALRSTSTATASEGFTSAL